jgi:hypothetical protein
MATEGGPKLVSDGLVLALDAANDKSFRGEPTTNVVTNWDLNTGWSKGYTEDIIFNEIPPPVGVDAPTVGFRNDDSGGQGFWYSYGDYAPQDPNTTYTISIYAKTNQTNGNFRIQAYTANNSETGRQFTSLAYITQPNIWQRLSWTITTPSNTQSDSLSFRYYGLYDGGYTRLWLCAPQMEANTKATRFVKGTRGTTVATGGGWADRSGNSNHGELVNGPAFDSDNLGSLVFDGGNDFVDSGFGNDFNPSQSSLSFTLWAKSDSPNASRMYFAPSSHGSNQRAYFGTKGGKWAMGIYTNGWGESAPSVTTSWTHVAGVFDSIQNVATLFVNSVSAISKGYESYTFRSDLQIGRGGGSSSSGFNWGGNISNVQVYNRALSESEILQNYNATKSRYGL